MIFDKTFVHYTKFCRICQASRAFLGDSPKLARKSQVIVNELFAFVGAGTNVIVVGLRRLLGLVLTEFVVLFADEIAG